MAKINWEKADRETAFRKPEAVSRLHIEKGYDDFTAELINGRTVRIKCKTDNGAWWIEQCSQPRPENEPQFIETEISIPRDVFEVIVRELEFTQYDI